MSIAYVGFCSIMIYCGTEWSGCSTYSDVFCTEVNIHCVSKKGATFIFVITLANVDQC